MDLFKESDNIIIFDCNTGYISLEEFLYGNDISGRLFRKLYKNNHIYLNG